MTMQVNSSSKEIVSPNLSTQSIVTFDQSRSLSSSESSPSAILRDLSDIVSDKFGLIPKENPGLEISIKGAGRRIVDVFASVAFPIALKTALGDNRYGQMYGFGVRHFLEGASSFYKITDLTFKAIFQKGSRKECLAEASIHTVNAAYHLLASASISYYPLIFGVEIAATILAPAKYREASQKINEVVNNSIYKTFGLQKPDFLLRLKSQDNRYLDFPLTKDQKEKIEKGAEYQLVPNTITGNVEVKVLDIDEEGEQNQIEDSTILRIEELKNQGPKRKRVDKNKSTSKSSSTKRETKKIKK